MRAGQLYHDLQWQKIPGGRKTLKPKDAVDYIGEFFHPSVAYGLPPQNLMRPIGEVLVQPALLSPTGSVPDLDILSHFKDEETEVQRYANHIPGVT